LFSIGILYISNAHTTLTGFKNTSLDLVQPVNWQRLTGQKANMFCSVKKGGKVPDWPKPTYASHFLCNG
jgi:hypothetical protein